MAKHKCENCDKEKDYPRFQCNECGSSFCEDCACESDFQCYNCDPELEEITEEDD